MQQLLNQMQQLKKLNDIHCLLSLSNAASKGCLHTGHELWTMATMIREKWKKRLNLQPEVLSVATIPCRIVAWKRKIVSQSFYEIIYVAYFLRSFFNCNDWRLGSSKGDTFILQWKWLNKGQTKIERIHNYLNT